MNKRICFLLFIIPLSIYSNIRGIYINRYAASNEHFYEIAEKAIQYSINAIVIDIKYDKGEVAVKLDNEYFVKQAYKPINALKEKIDFLKKHNIKPIARIVCFKDNILGIYNNFQYAAKYPDGNVFKDISNSYWVSPYSEFIRNYLINIAKKAAEIGFEEIQFDYIRFPNDFPENAKYKWLKFPEYNNMKNFEIIEYFLKQAYIELKPYNVCISADVFGYAVWYDSLGAIGQNLDRIAKYTDIIYPMVYPSHFGDNFLYKESYEQRTYDIVYESAVNGIKRISKYNTKIILYIQDFDWKKSKIGKDYVSNQINASLNSPANGFILWNSSSNYTFFNENIKYNFDKKINIKQDSLIPILR